MKTDFTPRLQRTFAAVSVGGAAVSLIASGVKYFGAQKEKKQAKAEGAALQRPYEKIPDEYFQNRNIAEQQALSGLSVDEKGYTRDQRGEAFGSAADALSKSGGTPNDYSKVIAAFNDSLKGEAAIDAQQHAKNIEYFMGVNRELAGQKTTQWGVNEYQPFESKLKEIQDRRIAATTNKNNAINEGIGSLAALSTSINSAVQGKTKTDTPGSPYGPGGNPNDVDLAPSGPGIDVASSAPTPEALQITPPDTGEYTIKY
jgi:hypothetical protein